MILAPHRALKKAILTKLERLPLFRTVLQLGAAVDELVRPADVLSRGLCSAASTSTDGNAPDAAELTAAACGSGRDAAVLLPVEDGQLPVTAHATTTLQALLEKLKIPIRPEYVTSDTASATAVARQFDAHVRRGLPQLFRPKRISEKKAIVLAQADKAESEGRKPKQSEIAESVGCSQSYVSKVLAERRRSSGSL